MYRFRERHHSHRKLFIALGCLLLVIVAGTVAGINLLKPETDIGTTPPPVVSQYAADAAKGTAVSTSLFTLTLPTGWKARVTTGDIPRPAYSWIGGSGDEATRWLNMYVDSVPANLAVNRVLPVQANGASLTVVSSTSDNCSNFTRPSATDTQNGAVSAKWDGTEFICDLANYNRDVVGMSSAEGINYVTLTGSTTGEHRIFMTYTDNSPSPDYSVFTNIVKSFSLK